jgi:lipopolysaccharide exporter
LDVSGSGEEADMILKRQAVSGVKWTGVSTIATTALQFIQLVVLSHILTPSDFGLMAMVMVIIGFSQAYADMGISNAIIHQQDATKEQLSSLYWTNILASIVVFAILVASRHVIVGFYKEPRLANIVYGASFIILLAPIGQQFQVLLEKELRFNRLASIEVISNTAGVIVAILSALQGRGVYSLIWGQLVTSGTKALALFLSEKQWRPRLCLRRKHLKGYIGFGMYQMGERSVNYLGSNMDKLIIGSLLGTQQLGFYSMAYQLAVKPIQILNPVITRVAFPAFARIQTDRERLKNWYLEAIQIIAVSVFPLYMGMIVLADPSLTLLLGSGWQPSVLVFRVLAVLGFFYSLGNPLGSLLLAKGRADLGFYMNVLRMVLYFVAILMGVRFGIVGIAACLLAATGGILFPFEFWIRRILVKMKIKEYIRSFVPALVVSLMMGFIIFFLKKSVFMRFSTLSGLTGLIIVGFCIYVPVLYFWKKDIFLKILKTARG